MCVCMCALAVASRFMMDYRWVHSSVVRAANCRSAGSWFKSGCALLPQTGTFVVSVDPSLLAIRGLQVGVLPGPFVAEVLMAISPRQFPSAGKIAACPRAGVCPCQRAARSGDLRILFSR